MKKLDCEQAYRIVHLLDERCLKRNAKLTSCPLDGFFYPDTWEEAFEFYWTIPHIDEINVTLDDDWVANINMTDEQFDDIYNYLDELGYLRAATYFEIF